MTPEQYTYLRKLPMTLHLPSEHTFVVHAGMLPYDVTQPMQADGQPLAHAPHPDIGNTADRRATQEETVLTNVPQNNDAFVLLNMRNVLHDHTISKCAFLYSISLYIMSTYVWTGAHSAGSRGTAIGTPSCPSVQGSTRLRSTTSHTTSGCPASR
jgi:hypothetical protein